MIGQVFQYGILLAGKTIDENNCLTSGPKDIIEQEDTYTNKVQGSIMKHIEDLVIKTAFFNFVVFATLCEVGSSEIYDFKVKNIKGELIDMSVYRGTVCSVLVFQKLIITCD